MLDIGFLINDSSDVQYGSWIKLIDFIRDFERQITFSKFKTRIGVVSFGDNATTQIKLSNYHTREEFEAAIKHIKYIPQGQNVFAGLKAAYIDLFKVEGGKLIIFCFTGILYRKVGDVIKSL